ncbi:hypothetical protein LTR95_003402 [Oleoguttula sp. CCFEE 5521]
MQQRGVNVDPGPYLYPHIPQLRPRRESMAAQIDPNIKKLPDDTADPPYIAAGVLDGSTIRYRPKLRQTTAGPKIVDVLNMLRPIRRGVLSLRYENALKEATWHNDFHPDLFKFGSKAENKRRHLGAMREMWSKLTGLPVPGTEVEVQYGAVVWNEGEVIDGTIAHGQIDADVLRPIDDVLNQQEEQAVVPVLGDGRANNAIETDETQPAEQNGGSACRTPSTLAGDNEDTAEMVRDATPAMPPKGSPQPAPPQQIPQRHQVTNQATALQTPALSAGSKIHAQAELDDPHLQQNFHPVPTTLVIVQTAQSLKHTRDAGSEYHERRVRQRLCTNQQDEADQQMKETLDGEAGATPDTAPDMATGAGNVVDESEDEVYVDAVPHQVLEANDTVKRTEVVSSEMAEVTNDTEQGEILDVGEALAAPDQADQPSHQPARQLQAAAYESMGWDWETPAFVVGTVLGLRYMGL